MPTLILEATKSTTTHSSTTDGDMILGTQSTQLLAKTTVTANIATSTDILSDVTMNTNTIVGN